MRSSRVGGSGENVSSKVSAKNKSADVIKFKLRLGLDRSIIPMNIKLNGSVT